MRVAIIGGGPSGLVQLKVLTTAHKQLPSVKPFEVKLFESYDKVGGVFLHHVYEDAELVSSKFLTCFSDFSARRDDEDFLSSERYREYLEEYATHFGLWPYINLNTLVTGVRRGDTSGHVVSYRTSKGEEHEWDCDAIAVCSGVHSSPNIPYIPGIQYVPTVIHSQDFKKREQFGVDKTVLVLGSGETGCDMSYLAITSPTKRVILSHRDGWIGAPKRLPNQRFLPWLRGDKLGDYPQLPVDVSQVTLFDTMYVHPIVRDSMLVWDYYNTLAIELGAWVCGGSVCGNDQWVGDIYGERLHASRLLFNKAWQRVQNYVSTPYRPTEWPLSTRIMRFFFHTAITPTDKTIDVAPFPSHFSSDGVAHFPITDRPESRKIQETVVKPDIIVFATGYVPSVPFLNTSHNAGRRAYPSLHETNVRNIWKDDDPTVGFIGFVRPGFGAIPPLAELQAMLFTTHLLGRLPNKLEPEDEWHYRIITPPGARIDYGVEHDSYAYQLAKDMDIAPSASDIFRLSLRIKDGWRLPCIWAAGASFNCKFRLTGMWKWDGAADRLTDELWETITRREEFFSNFTMSVLPLLYLGCINLLVFIYAYVWGVLVMFGLAKPLVHRNEPQRLMEELSRRHKATMMQKGDLATTAADPKIDGHSTTNHITAKVQGPTDYARALH